MQQRIKLIISGVLAAFMIFFLFLGSVRQIDAGQVGVKLRNGSVVGTLGDGLKFKVPVFEQIIKFESRTQKEQALADAASRDLQQINATIALNYRIDPTKVGEIYKDLGTGYRERVISPRLQEAVKTVTARYTAEELITKRPEVRETILAEIKSKLLSANIIVEDVSIVNLEFSKVFTAAIEEKQLAEQRAKTATNDLERIKIEAEQQITKAKGDSEAQRLQQATLNSLLLQKQFIEKWDGKLPVVMGQNGNILDLNSLTNPKP